MMRGSLSRNETAIDGIANENQDGISNASSVLLLTVKSA